MKHCLWSLPLLTLLTACLANITYQAYPGERLPAAQVATIEGARLLRQQWLNRYVDAVRFAQLDDITIDNNMAWSRLEVMPGYHEVTVYFYWDMGSARGLAPALVSYTASRESLSRTLGFMARGGQSYRVFAAPHFSAERQDITTLTHVDFWIEDQAGNEVVSREAGRYIPE